jgi:DNA mismatch repair ATPase MutS
VWPAIGAATITWLFARRWRAGVLALIGGVDKRSAELGLLVHAMACLEREKFQAPLLRELQQSLSVEGERPSRRVARLRRLVDWLDARRNQFMALLLAPLQWTTQLALAIEAWRRVDGPAVGRWMEAVGTLDALIALATFAFEHPDYPFPDIRDVTDGGAGELPVDLPVDFPILEAQGLGHPLLPARRRVVNDVALGGARRLMIVSGSNMSGKSTLLRSVGTNVVLALAGAPVCARALTLSPVQIGATLRINDSLQEGKSRFYAELTRLKQIVDRAGTQPPLLFLLDEILHGTNSHDRRIGAEAVLRGLVARGAIGLVTTHDLALTEVADALGPRAINVHFEDHLEDGVMTFDYQMKPGVVRKSNALALMRAVGLDVNP